MQGAAHRIDLLADNIEGDGQLLADRGWFISHHVIAKEKWHCALAPLPVRLAIAILPPAWGWKMPVWFIAARTHVSHLWTQTGTYVVLHVLHFLGEIVSLWTLWRGERATETWQMLTCGGLPVFYQHYFHYFYRCLWRWNDTQSTLSTGFWFFGYFIIRSRSWVFSSLGEGETVPEPVGLRCPRPDGHRLNRSLAKLSAVYCH